MGSSRHSDDDAIPTIDAMRARGTPADPIRVAIVDDHPMVVDGLTAALATYPDLRLVTHGGTFAEAKATLDRADIDVCLLDVRLLDGNGLQALSERTSGQRPFVLVISTFDFSQYVAAAVRFGAKGYFSKTVPIAELIDSIRKVARGDVVFTSTQLQKAFVNLTPQERRVVALAIGGLSNREIGSALGLSRRTVEGHLSEVFVKYKILGGRTELTVRAAMEGWLDIDAPRDRLQGRPRG
jgi:DNA-binding NarL/FixJ family response regulator